MTTNNTPTTLEGERQLSRISSSQELALLLEPVVGS
jgi:hypothetical protein